MPIPLQAFRDRMARLIDGRGRSAVKVGDPAQIVKVIAGRNEPLWPRLDLYEQQAGEYLRSAWVYVAVTRIAEAAALVPYQVYAVDGEAKIAQHNHPIERLLRNPNPTLSQFELLESTFGFLELTGNAYWFLSGPLGGAPTEIWPLRPDRMRIAADKQRTIGGYVYTVDGVDVPLDADEVIHFKRWNPTNDLYGLSPLEAAAIASQTDRHMAIWNRNFFSQEKAIPAGLVTIRNMVSDSDYTRIIREFRESFGGTERKTAFIRGADVSWADIGLSQKETDFLEARQLNRDEIFHIFGIPLGLYARNATEANATVARQTFLADTIWPKLMRLSQKITLQLAPFFGPNLIILPEEIRDTSADLAEVQAAGPYLTINEMRARFWNMPPLPEGDRINLTPGPSPQAAWGVAPTGSPSLRSGEGGRG
ncbi:MAG: phage portal protein [Anaerolineae bacterium]|nr:phage portal protein [Anaerolineae bacterium]